MKYTFLIIFSLFLVSCEDFFETTLPLEEPPFVEQLVVNSILSNVNPDESRALISKTIGLNENEATSLVNDAMVEIIFPDQSKYQLINIPDADIYLGYNYRGQLPEFQINQEYTIKVTSGNQSVASTVFMPNPASITSAVFMENGGLDEDGDEVSAIDILIDDAPDEVNYYKISAIKEFENYNEELYITTNNAFAIESASYKDILIKDDQFNGEEFKLRLQFDDFNFNYGEEPQPFEYKVLMKTITEEQYDHDRLLRGYFDNNDNPFASPVQISTNIEGGLGLFAIENETKIDVVK